MADEKPGGSGSRWPTVVASQHRQTVFLCTCACSSRGFHAIDRSQKRAAPAREHHPSFARFDISTMPSIEANALRKIFRIFGSGHKIIQSFGCRATCRLTGSP